MLNLLDYYLTRIDISPNVNVMTSADIDLVHPRPEHISLEIQYNFEESNQSVTEVFTNVTIKTKDSALSERVTYDVFVSLVGRFCVDEQDFPVDDKVARNRFKHTIIRNTASILIGHGREIIANTTGGMPLGRMLLPTLNLQGHAPQNTPDSTRKHKTKAKTK